MNSSTNTLLQKAIAYAAARSPFYREWFAQHKLAPEFIKTVADLRSLPTVNKNDLFEANEQFLCVPRTDVREYVTTSGTLGDPVWIGLTENDLQRLGRNEAYSYELAGLHETDLLQLTTTLDKRFMAGLAYWLGAREARIGVVRTGPGIPELQWDTIRRMGSTVLVAVPSFLLKMLEYAEREGFNPNDTPVRKAICIGEPVRNADLTPNALAQRIAEKWNIQLFGTYASTEMATAFTECEAGAGGHLNPELIVAECLNEDGTPVADGEPGEITVTTLGVEGMPLIRFRTGDVARIHTGVCTCGRSTPRIGPVEGRKQQMIKYRGTTLYPPAIFDLLNGLSPIETYVVELRHNDIGTDEIVVRVALKIATEEFEKELKDKFRAKLRVAPHIQFDAPETINGLRWPEGSRKARLLVDLR